MIDGQYFIVWTRPHLVLDSHNAAVLNLVFHTCRRLILAFLAEISVEFGQLSATISVRLVYFHWLSWRLIFVLKVTSHHFIPSLCAYTTLNSIAAKNNTHLFLVNLPATV